MRPIIGGAPVRRDHFHGFTQLFKHSYICEYNSSICDFFAFVKYALSARNWERCKFSAPISAANRRMKKDTRSRIIDAAIVLFDAHGVRGATVDAIAAEAGITKKTLYYHFRSKDDLMVASLVEAPDNRRRPFDQILKNQNLDAEGVVDALFWELSQWTADERWKGCAFSRAAAELVGLPGHPMVWAAKNYKDQIETVVRNRLFTQGVGDAGLLARRIVILLDGATLHGMVHHDPAYPIEAGRMALGMIRDATKRPEASDCMPRGIDNRPSFREFRDLGMQITGNSQSYEGCS